MIGKLRGQLCATQVLHEKHTDKKTMMDLLQQLGALESQMRDEMLKAVEDTDIEKHLLTTQSAQLQCEIDSLTATINNFIVNVQLHYKSETKFNLTPT